MGSAGTVAEEQEVKETALRRPRLCCSATLAPADAGSAQLPPAGTLRLRIPWNQRIQPRQLPVGGESTHFAIPLILDSFLYCNVHRSEHRCPP